MVNKNGFLVVGKHRIFNNTSYYGIDTEPWPIEEEHLSDIFDKRQMEKFEKLTDDIVPESEVVMII